MKVLSIFWHSVESDDICPQFFNGANPTQSVFREQIKYIIERYAPVSITEFLKIIKDKKILNDYSRPPVLLGFDDGFRNVVKYALPVLEEFQVPAVFFVIGEIFQNPDYVPWYVEIKHLLRKTEARKVSYNNIEFKLKTKEDRERFKAHLYDSFKKCRSEKERQNFLNNISRLLKIDRPYAHELDEDLQFINKDDVKIVNSSKLLTVASHAMTHRLLETLSYEEQQNELANSNLLLKEYFSSYYPVISYPDGSFNHDTIIIAKKIYEFGFAVLLGSSYLNWFAYPRICLENNTIQNLSYIFSPLRTNLVLPLKRALHKIEVFKSRLVSNLQKCQVSK